MGVEGEKSILLRILMKQGDRRKPSVILTDREWQTVNEMSYLICNAIADAIEQQPYVSQNVLNYTMAKVVAMTMKLNSDMFGYVGGEAEYMSLLIKHAWKRIKDQAIDYGSSGEPE